MSKDVLGTVVMRLECTITNMYEMADKLDRLAFLSWKEGRREDADSLSRVSVELRAEANSLENLDAPF